MNLAPTHLLLAQTLELPTSAASAVAHSSWMALGEVSVVIGSGLLIAIVMIIWVLIAKKRRANNRRHHSRHDRSSKSSTTTSSNSTDPEAKSDGQLHHHRRRVRRRDHRPRNPTLAETGGLPPVKPADSNPPPLL